MKVFTFARVIALFAVVVVGLLIWSAWSHRPVTAPPGAPAVVATPAAPIRGETRRPVPVEGGTVQAYPDKVKPALGLPSEVQRDPEQHVVDAAVVPASDRPQQVTMVIDAGTGEATTYVGTLPAPWLAFDWHGEAGIYYGQRFGGQSVRLEARQDVLQVKALRLQLLGSLDQPVDGGDLSGFAGVGLVYRW